VLFSLEFSAWSRSLFERPAYVLVALVDVVFISAVLLLEFVVVHVNNLFDGHLGLFVIKSLAIAIACTISHFEILIYFYYIKPSYSLLLLYRSIIILSSSK
jgi:hypothetical protein